MSKNTKTEKKPLSNGAKTAIWITAICAVAIVVLVVSLVLITNTDRNPETGDSSTSGSSSLTISNGDFLYVESESSSLPYEAQDWLKKTYGDGQKFSNIEDDEKVVMGVVNTTDSVWTSEVAPALAEKGLTANGQAIANPGTHSLDGIIDREAVEDDEVDIANVYMIATRQATSASILSNSFNIPASKSVKISVWLNAEQLNGKAAVMIQKSSTEISAQTYYSSNTQYWYAYDFEIEHVTTQDTNGWQLHEFYVFNRSSKSASVRLNIGLGNVYGADQTAEGVLFVDDITYEEVTSNEYREHYEDETNNITSSYIIQSTDTDKADVVSTGWLDASNVAKTPIEATVEGNVVKGAQAYLANNYGNVDGKDYSPFVATDTFDIVQVTATESINQTINLRKNEGSQDEYLHIYFWMRVVEGTQNAQADIVDIKLRDVSETDTDTYLATIKNVAAVADITTHDNNGWVQYHLYVKPDQDVEYAKVSLELAWSNTGLVHQGEMFVSDVHYEIISDSDYSSATSNSTTSVKADMSKTHATTGVTNGTFGYLEDTNKSQPENWSPVFAGSNDIYNDGKGDVIPEGMPANNPNATVGSGLVTGDTTNNPLHDDEYGYYLKVTNALATSHGYISQSVSLSANSVYRISVLAKADAGAKPYIYLINRALAKGTEGSRADAIIGRFEDVQTNSSIDTLLQQPVEGNGWVRYYFIIETADESLSLNVALFNGAIDATTSADFGAAGSSVYYDQVYVEQLGTYAIAVDTENEEATLQKVTYSAKANGYADLFENYFVNVEATTEAMPNVEFKDGETAIGNVQVIRVADAEKWAEMRAIPEETEEEVEEDTTTEDETDSDVDVGLLLSVISSIVLVAALLVVVVIKIFKKKRA